MKNKNFVFSERVKLQYCLDNRIDCRASLLAKQLDKSRSSIYYELKHYVIRTNNKDEYNNANYYKCPLLRKFPFCCNGCPNIRCSRRVYFYDAYKADEKAKRLLVDSRRNTANKRKNIKIINNSVARLIKDGLSIEVAINSVNNCPLSNSTVRRYIEKGLVNVKRIDLPRAVRFRVKKEYDYKTPKLSINVLNGRTYDDYLKYMSLNPKAKVIQIDSVIGKAHDKKAILTIYFIDSKLQIGFLYNRKHSSVVEILRKIYSIGLKYGYKLFDVVLTDNGSEFKNLYELEVDNSTGELICKSFYCDPYRSNQKAECEKNHVFFRRIIKKGKTLDILSQEEVNDIFSHINSYPRKSLNYASPYEIFSLEYNSIILSELGIRQIPLKNIKLKYRY